MPQLPDTPMQDVFDERSAGSLSLSPMASPIGTMFPPTPLTTPTENSPAIPIDIILMDLEMPVLGGLETVKRIRKLQADGKITGHVPVIAVTANARSEQIANAIEHGMDSVVTKPFRIPELVPRMWALVNRNDEV